MGTEVGSFYIDANIQNMKYSKFLLWALAPVIFLSSCTMEKRLYSSGYHIDWKKDKQAIQNNAFDTEPMAVLETTKVNPITTVSIEESELVDIKSNAELVALIQENSEEISVLVAEAITEKPRAEKRVAKVIEKRLEHFSEEDMAMVSHGVSFEQSNTSSTPVEDGEANGKSQMTALLLCFFVGVIGIHRFYLGDTTGGLIQLLTAGLCGIWTLIDFIRILTGDLKPKNGSYTKTL